MQPLAVKVRPKTLDDVVGQKHLLDPSSKFRTVVESGNIPNMIFYGPSGVGKTTIANIVADMANLPLIKLNATTAGTADIKDVIKASEKENVMLYLDEIQSFNKKQQQTLLEHMETGAITLIASTTENPHFCVYKAILSRSAVFEFKLLHHDDIVTCVQRALQFAATDMSRKVDIDNAAIDLIAIRANGDVRQAINIAELALLSTKPDEKITQEIINQLSASNQSSYDRDGDAHYDILSAYQKSLRGSDVNASLHYLARLLAAGDLTSACRRLMICVCEDVGLADVNVINAVKTCVDIALATGLPEARIPLANAVILTALAPKSNAAICAIDAAMSDLKNLHISDIPEHLKDAHYTGAKSLGHGQNYKFPHDYPNHWVEQQYLPDSIKDRIYIIPAPRS